MTGKQTVMIKNGVYITCGFTCVGQKESRGPLGEYFDVCLKDDKWGERSFEKAERKMFKAVLHGCMKRAGISAPEVDAVFAGDLLNQTISASFAALDFDGSYIGLYGACSTMALSMGLAACMIDGGSIDSAVCVTGSHFCTAERQYRMPLYMGTQRTPTAQWTVTGTGGAYLSRKNTGACIKAVTYGRVMDEGISDANNMGAAMAPAAADTIKRHFAATATTAEDYDAVVTGDLGKLGRRICAELLQRDKIVLGEKLIDCGCMIYSEKQDMHMGGSGCGCSAAVMNACIIPKIRTGTLKRVLFAGTGALMSLTSSMQGENIPAVAHAVQIEHCAVR